MPMTYRESMESMGTFLSVASSEKIPDGQFRLCGKFFKGQRFSAAGFFLSVNYQQ